MSYSIINEKINLQSCNISDLSQEIKDKYVEQFKDDQLEDLLFFYRADTDILVINKDHSDYDSYVFIVENYLEFDEEKRNGLKKQSPESIKSTIQNLDVVINHRMKARV